MDQQAQASDPVSNTGAEPNAAQTSHPESIGSVPVPANGISADEIALYDRQIRLWGMKAQEKIRNANILIITMKALGNEVAKNLVLAGIGSLTILDPEPVTAADLGAQFLLAGDPAPIGTNRAAAASAALQRLNPRVQIHVDTVDVRLKPPSFFAPFDIIIATDLDSPTLNIINTATRLNSRPFYAANSHGLYGFIFADLIEHTFVITRAKSNLPTAVGPETRTRSVLAVTPSPSNDKEELVTKRELYSTWYLASGASQLPAEIQRSPRRRRAVTPLLSCFRAMWEFTALHDGLPPQTDNHAHLAEFTRLCQEQHRALGLPAETLRSEVLRAFLQHISSSPSPASSSSPTAAAAATATTTAASSTSEVSPAAAVLGGQLAQDVINVLGRTQQPVQNFVIFDGDALEAGVYALHPQGELGRALLVSAAATAAPPPVVAEGEVPSPSLVGGGAEVGEAGANFPTIPGPDGVPVQNPS
ncbi:hypothetical protein C7999DRAFT_29541 [Corynascus novoguineensis]|uniref:Ubiquitin-like 1-activating enzyme E1A n=1 Tax=Corynascus novoguineensis TaxID=1126955 RepID=A0AAN7CZC0_9PEZI|nr:hypothetical protein C7999DRAFT_29541 [Corynascus novoguineensis]